MPLERLTPPAALPVSLTRAREYLRVDDTLDDALVSDLVAAAARRIEHMTGLALITGQWRLWGDCLPQDGIIRIPLAPVQSIDEVAVRTGTGWQVVAAADWQLDAASRPPRLRMVNPWPQPDGGLNAVRITLTAGFGADETAVPEDIRLAVLILAAHAYEFREGNVAERGLPPEVRSLLSGWRALVL